MGLLTLMDLAPYMTAHFNGFGSILHIHMILCTLFSISDLSEDGKCGPEMHCMYL